MTNLSPAAQAVASAYDDTPEKETGNHRYLWLAAALYANVAQVLPEEPRPTGMRPAGDTYSALEIRRAERMRIRQQFLAIADELEGIKYGTYRCNLIDKPQ